MIEDGEINFEQILGAEDYRRELSQQQKNEARIQERSMLQLMRYLESDLTRSVEDLFVKIGEGKDRVLFCKVPQLSDRISYLFLAKEGFFEMKFLLEDKDDVFTDIVTRWNRSQIEAETNTFKMFHKVLWSKENLRDNLKQFQIVREVKNNLPLVKLRPRQGWGSKNLLEKKYNVGYTIFNSVTPVEAKERLQEVYRKVNGLQEQSIQQLTEITSVAQELLPEDKRKN